MTEERMEYLQNGNWQEKTDKLVGNLSHYHFVHRKSHMNCLVLNPNLRSDTPTNNRLKYGKN
jgi:hypothetical protein